MRWIPLNGKRKNQEFKIDRTVYQSRVIAFSALQSQLIAPPQDSKESKSSSTATALASKQALEELELLLALDLVRSVPEVLAKDAQVRSRFLDRCLTFAVMRPDQTVYVRDALTLALKLHLEDSVILSQGPQVLRDLLALDEQKKDTPQVFRTAYTSCLATISLSVLEYWGTKTIRFEEKNPVRYKYVWEDVFDKLLNEFCAHSDATVRKEALEKVTRFASPKNVQLAAFLPRWSSTPAKA